MTTDTELTGRRRYLSTEEGLVLQVEVVDQGTAKPEFRWRHATTDDVKLETVV